MGSRHQTVAMKNHGYEVFAVVFLVFTIALSEPRRRRFQQGDSEDADFPRTDDGYQVAKAAEGGRKGKVFSLFNVIQFNNGPCQSTSTSTGSSNRNGTCYTENECTSKGGSVAGNCAAGFGVCCVFTTDETSDTISATVPNGATIPTICGVNTGEHIYLDYGDSASSITLKFNLNAVLTDDSSGRQWEIKVTQVECWNPNSPPNGCLQYSTGLTGRFTTFNFQDSDSIHLKDQQYSHCIRQECGYCCIQYQVCSDASSWSIDQGETAMTGTTATANVVPGIDTWCSHDYIGIPESNRGCSDSQNGLSFNSRYCGNLLGAATGGLSNIPVCDCTPPFVLDVFTDTLSDVDQSVGDNTKQNGGTSRGACLTWQQLPC